MTSLTRNTMALTIRTAVSIVIGLVTSRLVLSALGATDYGLLAVVTAVVVLIDFLNVSMSGATSRFMAFELGLGANGNARGAFHAAVRIHLFIAAILLVMAQTVGLWYVNTGLAINPECTDDVNWVYQFTVIAAIFAVIRTPMSAWLMARERMATYAGIEIIGTLLRLAVVILLASGIVGSSVTIYVAMLAGVSMTQTGIYYIVSQRDIKHIAQFSGSPKYAVRAMLKYSALDIIGNLSVIFHAQGMMLAINTLKGLATAAALSLANAVQSAVLTFVGTIVTAIRPQVIKRYAAHDNTGVIRLACHGATVSVMLYMMVATPLFLNAETVMSLWLGDIPAGTVALVKALLIVNIFSILTNVTNTIIHASGRILALSLVTGAIYIAVPFVLYAMLATNNTSDALFWTLLAAYPAIMLVSLILSVRRVGIALLWQLAGKCFLPTGIMLALTGLVAATRDGGDSHLIIDTILSVIVYAMVTMFVIGYKNVTNLLFTKTKYNET